MPVVAIDTETHLIRPGCKAPRLVCVQWQFQGLTTPNLRHRDRVRAEVEELLRPGYVLVGHNCAYDMAVIAAQWPEFLPAIFAKYDRDEITDTKIREQLIQIAKGQFRGILKEDGETLAVNYDLAACIARHFQRRLPKEGFRLFYRAFEDTPNIDHWVTTARNFQYDIRAGRIPDWVRESPEAMEQLEGMLAAAPEEAVRYALDDPKETLNLYESQERQYAHTGVFVDQFRQARAAFACHLSSCHGVYTDPDAVDALEVQVRADFDALKLAMQAAGLVRSAPGKKKDGTADTKAAMAAMEAACAENNLPVLRTKKGRVSLSAEACARFEAEDTPWQACSTIGQYSWYLTLRKTLSNDLKMLRDGCDVPLQPSYDIADTGRRRCAKPNLQAINRGAGIRECIRPRDGTLFAQGDYEGLELHTLAVWCLEKFGHSKLAEALNAGQDAHLVVGAEFLGISYEEALRRKGDKDVKEARQRAKPVNFGYAGGLGIAKFVRYARTQYNVEITEDEAKVAKERWIRRFPELRLFFQDAAQATANNTLATDTHLFTGRIRGGLWYAALCNGRFQGLGADAANEAMWRVTRACYVEPESPLYGCRVVAFIHDELILEVPIDRASAAAKELGRLMCEGANIYLGRVPVRVKPQLMTVWSKNAVPVYDVDGNLIPWAPKVA